MCWVYERDSPATVRWHLHRRTAAQQAGPSYFRRWVLRCFHGRLAASWKYGFGGSFAIVTGFVGQPGYVNWDQIKQMAGSQMEMMSHTVNHADLNRSPDAVVRNELAASKRALEEALGKPVPFLVYPSGEPFFRGSPQRQQQVVAMVREAGYSGALAVKNALTQDPNTPYALNRIRVSGGVDIRKFAENMGGPLPETVGC